LLDFAVALASAKLSALKWLYTLILLKNCCRRCHRELFHGLSSHTLAWLSFSRRNWVIQLPFDVERLVQILLGPDALPEASWWRHSLLLIPFSTLTVRIGWWQQDIKSGSQIAGGRT